MQKQHLWKFAAVFVSKAKQQHIKQVEVGFLYAHQGNTRVSNITRDPVLLTPYILCLWQRKATQLLFVEDCSMMLFCLLTMKQVRRLGFFNEKCPNISPHVHYWSSKEYSKFLCVIFLGKRKRADPGQQQSSFLRTLFARPDKKVFIISLITFILILLTRSYMVFDYTTNTRSTAVFYLDHYFAWPDTRFVTILYKC